MLNYIKSELYRVFHSKGIYVFVGVCSMLMLAMNGILWYFGTIVDKNFPYDRVDFSFSMLTTGMGIVVFLIAAMCSVISADDFKYRTVNNSVAFGFNRIHLFISKVIINLMASVITLVVVVGTLIISAYAMLEYNDFEPLKELLTAVVACVPSLIACVITFVSFYYMLGSMNGAVWGYIGLIVGVPTVVSLLGMKIKVLGELNKWLVYTILTGYTVSEEGELLFSWSSAQGFKHCILVGGIGIIVLFVLGICAVRKKEI